MLNTYSAFLSILNHKDTLLFPSIKTKTTLLWHNKVPNVAIVSGLGCRYWANELPIL